MGISCGNAKTKLPSSLRVDVQLPLKEFWVSPGCPGTISKIWNARESRPERCTQMARMKTTQFKTFNSKHARNKYLYHVGMNSLCKPCWRHWVHTTPTQQPSRVTVQPQHPSSGPLWMAVHLLARSDNSMRLSQSLAVFYKHRQGWHCT